MVYESLDDKFLLAFSSMKKDIEVLMIFVSVIFLRHLIFNILNFTSRIKFQRNVKV